MAEEVLYSSAGGDSNKRKYEDSPPALAARRATGFSSAPEPAHPPPLYNSVPPPMSEIEIAKQKAQEIAARLLSNADPLKRARVDNGGGGFDSSDYSKCTLMPTGSSLSGQPQVVSSGYPGPSKKIEIPNGRVGVIIGKGGDTIKYLQLQSGAKIQVTRDMDADPNSAMRAVDLMGTPEQIAKAEQLINDVLSEAEGSGSGAVSRRLTGQTSGSEQFVMKVANNKVGLVIGKGGETIKSMQARTGARIQVIPLHLPPGDMSKERTVQIDGTSDQIEAAKQLVEEVTSEVVCQEESFGILLAIFVPLIVTNDLWTETSGRGWTSAGNRVRNPTMSSGYSQQGYQAPTPNNYGPPMQQPSYGYTQPGAYPGQPTPYNANQPPYSGYPPQPTSGYANATGWDQSTAPQNQQTVQGGGYDYYNQQQPSQQQQTYGGSNPPSDGSGYNYSQPQAYGQGQVYTQDGYGNYNAPSGYDHQQQQQQGYSNTNYGNVSNPTPDGPTKLAYGTQGETNQAPPPGQTYGNAGAQSQPAANPNYAPQGGYGAQTPAGYGPPQPQKPPGGPAVYAQPPQGQPSSYPVSQAGYVAPPYGAPPAAQPGYMQYQQAPAYNGTYGGGYSQPPAYSSDATPPPTQSGQAGGPVKASPPS
ncbi:hypothetical protein OROMI_028947 [Orobanche minor]